MPRYANVRSVTKRNYAWDSIYATVDEITGFWFFKKVMPRQLYQKHEGGPWRFHDTGLWCPAAVERMLHGYVET